MAYFDGIVKGDRVWSFEYGYGNAEVIKDDLIRVYFSDYEFNTYDYNGIPKYKDHKNQTLFWDEIKFDIPEKPKIKLKNNYDEYIKEPEMAEASYSCNSIKQIKQFAKLLSLRDQECPKSRGYEFQKGKMNFTIKKDLAQEKGNEWVTTCTDYYYFPDRVYFKTEEDAKKICRILNSGRFNFKGE